MRRLALSVVLLAALGACGGGGGDDKPLFSLWTRDGDNAKFDLSNGQFSTPMAMAFYQSSGAQCNCTVLFVGDESAGSVVTNACYLVPGSGTPLAACEELNGSGSYSKVKSALTLTGKNGSANFH